MLIGPLRVVNSPSILQLPSRRIVHSPPLAATDTPIQIKALTALSLVLITYLMHMMHKSPDIVWAYPKSLQEYVFFLCDL